MSPQLWTYRAAKVRTLDGDSLVCDADLGFFVTLRVHVRLLGVDAPELRARDPAARAAAQHAKARLNEIVPLEFVLRTAKDPDAATDKYGGRWLGDVLLPDGRTASEVLVAEGLARPYAGGPRRPWPTSTEAPPA